MLRLRETRSEEIQQVLEIINAAKALLRQDGIPQWNTNYPEYIDIERDCQRHESFVLVEDDKVIGTCALVKGPEKNYQTINGSWIRQQDDYVSIHRITLSPLVQGKGYMQTFLKLIEDFNSPALRVDTHQMNVRMIHHLEKAGYKQCGIVWMSDGSERVAFEKILG